MPVSKKNLKKSPHSKLLFGLLLVFILLLIIIFITRFIFGGNEDSWICQNGNWVKHGFPNTLPPSAGCGQQLVGSDRDEHGCIGSAGYSWCGKKQKCLRIWEEPCK